MPQKKVNNYGLYQTLSNEISNDSILSSLDKENLLEKANHLSYGQKKALFMLIYEHARLKDDFQYNSQDILFPYSIKQEENDVYIDLSKLPNDLQWILWKFLNVTNVLKKT